MARYLTFTLHSTIDVTRIITKWCIKCPSCGKWILFPKGGFLAQLKPGGWITCHLCDGGGHAVHWKRRIDHV